jgi:hypothetical protein
VKEAEGALVPVLLEKYGSEFVTSAAAARAGGGRSAGRNREFGASTLDHK